MEGREQESATAKSQHRSAALVAANEDEFGDRSWPWPQVQPLVDAGWEDLDLKTWLVSPHPALWGQRPADISGTRLSALVQEERKGVC